MRVAVLVQLLFLFALAVGPWIKPASAETTDVAVDWTGTITCKGQVVATTYATLTPNPVSTIPTIIAHIDESGLDASLRLKADEKIATAKKDVYSKDAIIIASYFRGLANGICAAKNTVETSKAVLDSSFVIPAHGNFSVLVERGIAAP